VAHQSELHGSSGIQLGPSFRASWRAYRELQLSELAVLAD